jgi:hypothetical protein
MFDAKHRVNMAQVYAFGHKQRHPEWDRDHWTECYGLMSETFGRPDPSLREMLAANPRAVWDHFAWNLALTPSGFQLLLFNRASGSVHPDYFPSSDRRLNRVVPAVLAGLVLALWAFGLVCLWRGGSAGSRLVWAGVAAVAAVAPLVILTQRPRPSYLLALGAGLIALTGLGAWAAATRWGMAGRLRAVAPLLMLAVVLLAPRQFKAGKTHAYRPLAEAVERLRPYAGELAAPDVTLLAPPGVAGAGTYLTGQPTAFVEFTTVLGRWPETESLAACLDREKIRLAYLDEYVLRQLAVVRPGQSAPFVDGRATPGWERVDGADAPGSRWRLYRKVN